MDFDRLYRELYPSLHRYLCRLTGDPEAANDAAQEAFMTLLRRQLPESEVKPWLFTVATNVVRDRARRDKTRRRLVPKVRLLTPHPSRPDDEAERADTIRTVRDALERIPERDRKLLLLREEGFSYKEIAEAVGVAPGSVGTLIARALKKFEAEFGSTGNENESRD
ncbi:MAG TPA: sigma-70 family RNA polymerase sigma factor [Longimicrobiales bacterium]|nr:sigma-70 family RNA polymerase sigma factor [Longimicrobiales bacterium]